METVVTSRLTNYLNTHGLMPQLQSANVITAVQCALLKMLSDIYAAIDRREVTLLGLLDLSAAYDLVDYDILLRRLHHKFGIWVGGIVPAGPFTVGFYRGRLSVKLQWLFGVPQRSVLGSLPFLLYTAELFDVIAECGFTGHAYADDTQV